jgi:hypothetical protein
MPLAVITLRQIIEIIVLFTIVNVVLLAPVVVALIGAYNERVQNRGSEPQV